jgi:hypothetical protein
MVMVSRLSHRGQRAVVRGRVHMMHSALSLKDADERQEVLTVDAILVPGTHTHTFLSKAYPGQQ